MSRIHIRFTKEQEAGDMINYRVDSSDFSKAMDWELIGRVAINRSKLNYIFEPLGRFVGFEIVPPSIFEMEESERNELLVTQYAGCVYGGWSSRIAKVTRSLIENNEFPEEAYGIT